MALGKLDENGAVAEDLRGQILGQLGSQLSYDTLYREALKDPALRRTKQELDVAMENADQARRIVFDLFQDLDRFDLSDYRRHDDGGAAMGRLVEFVKRAVAASGGTVTPGEGGDFAIADAAGPVRRFTTDRDRAMQAADLDLVGTEHPLVQRYMVASRALPAAERALVVRADGLEGILTLWRVTVHAPRGQTETRVVPIGLSMAGDRNPRIERMGLLGIGARRETGAAMASPESLRVLVERAGGEVLHREMAHAGLLPGGASYSARLLAVLWVSQ